MLRLGPVKLMLCSNSWSKVNSVQTCSFIHVRLIGSALTKNFPSSLPEWLSSFFMCKSIYEHVSTEKKVRNAAGGREEEMKFVRYQQNYPQYKIIICNFFLIRTRLSRVPQGLSDTVKQPRTENERDMILQKAIYTKTKARKYLQITSLIILFFIFLWNTLAVTFISENRSPTGC